MKTKKNLIQLVLMLTVALTSCFTSMGQIGKESLPDIDPFIYKNYLNNKLKFSVKGYAFYLTKDGNYITSDQGGVAKTAEDNNGKVLAYNIDTRQEIASVSKTITAVAILRVLEKSDLVDVNSKIGPWLPKGWKPTTSFASLTFRQLLSHRSGLRNDTLLTGPGYENLIEKHALKTIDPDLQKVSSYLNINFQIIRICMPNILSATFRQQDLAWAKQFTDKKITKLEYNALIADAGSSIYRNYVMEYLFKPAGITAPTCNPVGASNLAWAYETRTSTKGAEGKDHSQYCSSGFWQVSAKDYTVFMTKVMHSQDIINSSSKAIMNNGADPFTVGWSYKAKRGNGYNYGHGGDINWGLPEVHSYVLYMPGNYVAYVHINSGEFGSSGLRGLLYEAFDAARKFPYNCYNNGGTYQFPNQSMAGHISKVGLGKLQQSSGASTGYTYYDNYITSLKQDSSYTLTLQSSYGNISGNVYWSVWIDYNRNNVFDDSERIFAKASKSGIQEQVKIKIPLAATLGLTRMRVALKRHDTETIPNACASFAFGEVEDYRIDITKPCGLITNLKTVNLTSTGASLRFDKAIDNVSSYVLRYQQIGTNIWITKTVSPTSPYTYISYELANLKPNIMYIWQVRSNCGDFAASQNFTTQDVNICGTDLYEANPNSVNAKTFTLGETKTALICSNTTTFDQDWFKFTVASNTVGGTKIKIDLTSLPADYDLYLYKSDLTLSSVSLKRGTMNETIEKILANGTYYVKVVGYANAKHTHFYYQLTIKKSDVIVAGRLSTPEEVEASDEAIAYPNPVIDGVLNVEFEKGLPNAVKPIVKFNDSMGNELTNLTQTIEDGKSTLDLSSVKKGIYTLRIIRGEKITTKKIVVQ